MSRDNWARIVEATLKREQLRQLAFCPSFSTCTSLDDSTPRFSLDSTDFETYGISTETIIPEASSGQSIIPSRRAYTIKFEEIKKATKDFHPDFYLGDGRFGPVYKGWINEYNMTAAKPGSGLTVVIKKWKLEGFEMMREWLNEIKFASIRQMEVHPNVVRLIAHSYGEGDLFLVYQFMPNANNIEEVYRVYTIEFEEIKKATKNFQPDLILGEGSFARVYKGWFHENNIITAAKPGSGLTVAVKKRKLEGFKGLKEWLNEIKFLSKLQHPNLVKLIAHSSGEDSLVLVYELMPYGNLDYHLFKRKDQSLPWATRMKVAKGVSRALSFLHSKEIQVIHVCFMPENILLDREYNAKLNGFSLAIDGPIGDMTLSTEGMETYGYAAPEYMSTGHLTAKCDVYCFGILLLELLTGHQALDMSRGAFDRERNFFAWAQPYLRQKSKLKKIMDTKLEGHYPKQGAYIVASLVSKCLSSDPTKRPTMAEVLVALENLQGV